jgi:hypothetical protein
MNIQIFSQYKHLLIGACFCTAWLITFRVLALAGWPGETDTCVFLGQCYCETIQWAALIRQPVNTFTNLVPVACGLYLLWRVDRDQAAPRSSQNKVENPLGHASFHAVFYGLLTSAIGLGSMFFHGGMVIYGGFIDVEAMNLYLAFLLAYNVSRLMKLKTRGFIVVYIILNAGILLATPFAGHRTDPFSIMVVVEIAIEFVILILARQRAIHFTRDWRLFIWSLITFGAAILAWILSRTGAPLCWPDSFWQGHGLWHYLVGIAPVVIFFYMRTERPIPSPPQ